MGLSHRDLRAERAVREAFWTVLALVAAIAVLAFVAPTPLLGLATLFGLAGLGGGYLVATGRLLDEYSGDLRAVRDRGHRGWLRAEAGYEVEFDRTVGLPTQRSPHTRPSSGRTQPAPPTTGPGR